jgi:glutamyl/glutaminyl-tRNA synthetase
MRNFLALIGWNPGGEQELFPGEALLEAFTIEKIQKSGGAFNEEKLKWMNKEYLGQLPDEAQVSYVITALPDYDVPKLTKLAPTILERVHNQVEIKEADAAGEYDWAFTAITYETSILKWKNDDSVSSAFPRLKRAQALLAEADFTSVDTIKESIWTYAEEVGRGELLWPLRVSLSGKERSPDPFTCAFVLGKEDTLARIQVACDKIG